ncbi:hypothetical protein [Pseudooceanicola sp.]|uniref:hypothetical protein n=1 Tax=Pseudooceanicola sp. TaxID=1914328 RepID=UPI00260FC3EF|nr:hypothetical protein [Pseudooceanicola sp.]MDF1855392.1 hypothetical protein [Pseudooceanicola sp.]
MTLENPRRPLDTRLIGPGLFLLWLLVTIDAWGGPQITGLAAAWLFPVLIALQAIRVRRMRLIFVGIGLALILAALSLRSDGGAQILAAFDRAAFIMAFFTALTTLRHAADTSAGITACGMFLAHQPPGRRYIALSAGAHMFAVPLNFGSIALLGSLSVASAADEPDPEIRHIRTRRMLLAIQRGFSAMLPWSPLAFAVVISTVLLPDLIWARAVPYALVSSGILIGVGWALDTIFKPRRAGTAAVTPEDDGQSWASVLPLLTLLVVLIGLVLAIHQITGMRVTAVILLQVPALAVAWFALQAPRSARLRDTLARSRTLIRDDLPEYREELLLIGMAGFIGALGATLLTPWVAAAGLNLSGLPAWAALVVLIWLIPLAGQVGMSPLLAVTLMFPIIPAPADLGVSTTTLFVAITGGWTLGAISSPFAAPTLLMARFGGVSPLHVSWRWNGAYTLLCGLCISAWVVAMTHFGLG